MACGAGIVVTLRRRWDGGLVPCSVEKWPLKIEHCHGVCELAFALGTALLIWLAGFSCCGASASPHPGCIADCRGQFHTSLSLAVDADAGQVRRHSRNEQPPGVADCLHLRFEPARSAHWVVIGVHTPEFAFEKNLAKVGKALAALGVGYPLAIDNDFGIWRAFSNSSLAGALLYRGRRPCAASRARRRRVRPI